MPTLKETYLQIQERNRREIRNRTKARVEQLQREENNRNRSCSNQEAEDSPHLHLCPLPHLHLHLTNLKSHITNLWFLSCFFSVFFCHNSFFFFAMRGLKKPFKASRQVQTQETTFRHRKDGFLWGKTMEKQLAKMDKSRQSSCQDAKEAETDSDEDHVPLVQVLKRQTETEEAREKRAGHWK
jgi:hypothetical protein